MIDIRAIVFEDLSRVDLPVGAVCETGPSNSWGDDPISHILPVDNQGGFRSCGPRRIPGVGVIGLLSDRKKDHWPDHFEDEGRRFIYYGDNKHPDHDLHDTNKSGNVLLRDMFHALHTGRFANIPPIFVFLKTGKSRNVFFEGMAVPGAPGLAEHDDLVAFWSDAGEGRFLNYRAAFTMLPEQTVSAAFLASIRQHEINLDVAPPSWVRWRESGLDALRDLPPRLRPWADSRA